MKIEIEREEDGRWVAEIPDLPGVMAYGRTREEAVFRVEALADWLESTHDDRCRQRVETVHSLFQGD